MTPDELILAILIFFSSLHNHRHDPTASRTRQPPESPLGCLELRNPGSCDDQSALPKDPKQVVIHGASPVAAIHSIPAVVARGLHALFSCSANPEDDSAIRDAHESDKLLRLFLSSFFFLSFLNPGQGSSTLSAVSRILFSGVSSGT